MDIGAPNTKTVLLLAAGELFADHGFDAVSTRMIADKAKVNLGGIHYHFGSKEALYVAAFKYVCENEERPGLAKLLNTQPELEKTPEGRAKAILMTCRNFLDDLFDPSKPDWKSRLILREISTPSSALPILVREVFTRDFAEDIELYQRLKPGASYDEAMIWQGMLKTQAIFYLMAKTPLEMMRGNKPLDQDFLDSLIRTVAKSMIMLVDLPVPEELR
ncbi:MAG: TetR/AcrR family transcriptional regulator [Planctomycetes bacterium]|nr:TetR/AcrR family transcriptional regulator [Planctomycetota bacterium]